MPSRTWVEAQVEEGVNRIQYLLGLKAIESEEPVPPDTAGARGRAAASSPREGADHRRGDEGRIVDPPDIEGQIEILGKGEDRGVGFGACAEYELRGLSGRDEFRVRIPRRVSLASMTESEGGPEIAVERRWG